MENEPRANGSLWAADSEQRFTFGASEGNIETDVVVIGGGIAGLTSALFLARRGRRVVLLEAQTIGSGETGKTTAHLTQVLDAGYVALERKFGVEGATLAAQASWAAIDSLETLCSEFAPNARFERVSSFKYAETEEQVKKLEQEVAAMRRAGVRAEWTKAPIPFPALKVATLPEQAQVHAGRLVEGLIQELSRLGVSICENRRVTEVHDGEPCKVVTTAGTLRARAVLCLTNVPVLNRIALHTKVAAYRSYVIAGPADSFPAGLFEDCAEPYHYVRRQETSEGTFVLLGGADHRTGKSPATPPFEQLREFARTRIPSFSAHYFWSGQIIEPSDGLPFIGRNSGAEHTYVATGFSGTGITFGVLSAMLLTAAVEGLESPWAPLFSATRVRPFAQAERYVSENATFPSRVVADRGDRGGTLADLEPGTGELIRAHNGRMLAVSRKDDGSLRAHSAVCPHMGCYVHFNAAERTWDCPCHGSRFALDGTVLNGPSTMPLTAVAAPEAREARDTRAPHRRAGAHRGR